MAVAAWSLTAFHRLCRRAPVPRVEVWPPPPPSGAESNTSIRGQLGQPRSSRRLRLRRSLPGRRRRRECPSSPTKHGRAGFSGRLVFGLSLWRLNLPKAAEAAKAKTAADGADKKMTLAMWRGTRKPIGPNSSPRTGQAGRSPITPPGMTAKEYPSQTVITDANGSATRRNDSGDPEEDRRPRTRASLEAGRQGRPNPPTRGLGRWARADVAGRRRGRSRA